MSKRIIFLVVVGLCGYSLLCSNSGAVQGTESEPMTIMIKPGPPPSGNVVVSAADARVDESEGTLVFPVTLSEVGEQAVTMTYRLADETAVAGSDYEASAGTLTIPPGSQSAEIPVVILDDTLNEPEETFVLELTDAANATIKNSQAMGTIVDNDELPAISISDATAEELAQKMIFTVTLSSKSGQDVTVDFTTVDETAVAGSDYASKNGTLTIPAGAMTAMIGVAITLDENRKEDEEIFFVELQNPQQATLQVQRGTGTIQNTAGSLVGRMLGRPIPEPSTVVLVALGLVGIGLLAKRKTR